MKVFRYGIKVLVLLFATVIAIFAVGCNNEQSSTKGDGDVMTNGNSLINKEIYEFNISKTYKNPMEIEGQHGPDRHTGGKDYGIGDPFVIRYNGKYYLYPSSNESRVKVFESIDLVNWEYKGEVTQGDDVYYAYAPEVVYYDGMFYMVTSPHGNGHYILKSESPYGPFQLITDNFGHQIDGSFWITDDDRLFLLYPMDRNIWATELNTKTMLPLNKKIKLNATLKGWTEGPGLFRRGDYHYLTYTGNHVISTGYRVAYSYIKGDDPFGQYIMPEDNILLLRSEHDDEFHGLGHSSNVIGPDLDSIYTPYHNLISANGPQRRYCLDRLLTNGNIVYSTGATNFEVPVPDMPQIYGWFDDPEDTNAEVNFDIVDNEIVSKEETADVFTAEYNFSLKSAEKQPVDLKFGIKDSSWWAVRIDTGNNSLSLISVKDGVEKTVASAKIKTSHGYRKLCTVRVENTGRLTYVYFNSARKLEIKDAGITGGKIGAFGENVLFGYIAANSDALGSSDYEAIKNIPGKFAAMHYLKGENRGFNIFNAVENPEGIRYGEKESSIINKDGSYSLLLDTAGDWVSYPINVSDDGLYGVTGKLSHDSAGAVIELIVDDDKDQVYRFTIPESSINKADNVNLRLGDIPLKAGFHTLTLRLVEGKFVCSMLEFFNANSEPWSYESDFVISKDRKQWLMYGPWQMKDGKLSINSGNNAFALLNTSGLSDYEIEAELEIADEAKGEAGIIFRVTNPSLFDLQVKESFTGYGIRVDKTAITMSKYNYGKIGGTQLIDNKEVKKSNSVRLKIIVKNNHIQVYVNDQKEPALDYRDPAAWLYGRPGFYSFGNGLTVNKLKVTALAQQ